MNVTLYGPTLDYGSFVRVAAGMRNGLEQCHALAGFIPYDAEKPQYESTARAESVLSAEVAVCVGSPEAAFMLPRTHRRRLLMLAPNSTWLPALLLEGLEGSGAITGYVTPSEWGAGILRNYTKLPVDVWQHGIDTDVFTPNPGAASDRLAEYRRGDPFRLLHVASSCFERKGTRQLIEALNGITDVSLRLVVLGPPGLRALLDGCKHPWAHYTGLAEVPYTQFHAVVQPSRAEGFGCVGLEALACGVPAIVTAHTGHAEWWDEPGMGVKMIWTSTVTGEGPQEDRLAPIDDGPGAMAPIVEPEEIREAILYTFHHWEGLAGEATRAAEYTGHQWSWKAVTAWWIATQKEEE